MVKYLTRTVLSWAALIFLATNFTYFLANWFLNPVSNYLGRKDGRSLPEQIENAKRTLEPLNLNPDVPILQRWWIWISGIFTRWDWGSSPVGVSVNSEVAYRMMVSAQLVLLGTFLAAILGVIVGVRTASRQYKTEDRIWQGISIVAMNTHVVVVSFVVVSIAIAINNFTQAQWGVRPFFVTGSSSIGVTGFFPTILDFLQHLILPTISLIIISYASYHFTQRSLLLDNINADYVRTARAKGLTRNVAIRRHALRTSIIPVATSVAFAIPGVFTGAIMTETIFGWKGMGQYFIQTILKNDIHGVVAVAAFGALTTAIGAILADIFVVLLDPRVRVS